MAVLDFNDTVESDRESARAVWSHRLESAVLEQSALLARCEKLCGLTLSVIDPASGRFVSGVARHLLPETVVIDPAKHKAGAVHVVHLGNSEVWVYFLSVPGTDLRAGGVLLPSADSVPHLIRATVQKSGLSEFQFEKWRGQHSGIRPDMALRLLQLARASVEHDRTISQTRQDTTSVAEQLVNVYEEMALLYDLPKYMHPDIPPLSLAEALISRVHQLCGTELSACCLRHRGIQSDVINGPWGLEGAEIESLLHEVLAGRTPRILVKNQIATSRWHSRFPRVRSLVAVPIFASDASPSWLVLANPLTRPELGTEEANLLNSIGQLLAAHMHVFELFHEREDMVLDFIRSLVSTLDAKDATTRGHSERVALVAERVAQALGLPADEVQAIYRSGLLHDIGKIGVDDAVLRKPGALTDSEFQHMALHPELGYKILCPLKSLAHLLDGVRHHHERFDGRGFPQKLAGKAIPKMARVLAVADAFDAMRSDRPYRQGMSPEEVERILTQGAGTQWDPEVVAAFFKARAGIYRAWQDAVQRLERDHLPLRDAAQTE